MIDGPNQLVNYHWDNNLLECQSENKVLLRVDILTDDIVRIRYGQSYFQDDFSYAIAPKFEKKAVHTSLVENEDNLVIATKTLECKIRKTDLKVSFFDREGHIINEDEKGFHWEYNQATGNSHVQMSKYMQEGEIFYGLGDKPAELNLKGKYFEIWGTDHYGYDIDSDPLYKNIPFYYGLHHNIAYGIFFDNSFRSYFDFGKIKPKATSFTAKGGEMNYYFIAGPTLTEVAQRYCLLTGTADMPAMWALGFHQCKWSYFPESKVMEICNTMRSHQIPCDAIYLDIDYMHGFRCFTWNEERFPEPKKMIQNLKDAGFKTVVIIDPGIKKDWSYKLFQEGIRHDYFCKRPDGPYAEGLVWPGECYFPDFTNPEVREWWSNLYKELIGDIGIAGIWNDMNEPALFEVETKTMPLDVRHDYDGHPCSHAKAHNVYGMQMARATYQGVKKYGKNKRGLIITRSGYSGLQRYSSVWTGDNISNWRHIWLANVQCQRLSISGVSFAGSDIGGFIGKPNGELYERWIQMGIFHPFCRVHSSQDDGDQEPWAFGDGTLQIVKKAIELRYRLLPYIYTAMYQYHKYGTPVLKPLSFYDQTDPINHTCNSEFLCGEHILTASIEKEGAKIKELYLPKGKWYDYWKNENYIGGKKYEVKIERDTFPLFIAEGAVIPFYPLQQYVDECPIDIVDLKVYFKNGQSFSHLYEDIHDGYEYEEGQFRFSTFNISGGSTYLTISHTWEGHYAVPYRYRLTFIGLPFMIKSTFVNGVELSKDTLLINSDFTQFIISSR